MSGNCNSVKFRTKFVKECGQTSIVSASLDYPEHEHMMLGRYSMINFLHRVVFSWGHQLYEQRFQVHMNLV